MQLNVNITGVPGVRDALRRAPKTFAKTLRQAVHDVGMTFTREFAAKHMRGKTGPENVGVRTGNLRRAFGYRATGTTLDDLAMHFGFGPPAVLTATAAVLGQARAHLFGATIRPKTAKWLWLPLKANQTRAGVARLRPSDLPAPLFLSRTHHGPDTRAQGRSRRADMKDLIRNSARPIALQRRAGPGWVILWRGKALFVLVPEVVIPARLPFWREWDKFQPRVTKRLEKAATDASIVVDRESKTRGAGPAGGA